jgi:hypothetical protein
MTERHRRNPHLLIVITGLVPVIHAFFSAKPGRRMPSDQVRGLKATEQVRP